MSALLNRRPAPEKVVAFAVAVAPAAWLVGLAYQGELGVRPVTEAIRISGDWALRLFWLVLLVSPARRILAAPRLIRARRILGRGAFGLTALHFGLYALDQQFDWIEVGLEVLLRTYLTFGAAAMIGLAVLAASSSDRAVSRLGGARWNRLHQGVYAIAALSLVHFLLRSRTNTFEPMLMFGLFAWLMGYRLTHRFAGDVTPARLLGLAVAAAALTATAETCWHAAATGVDARRILAAHLDITHGLRPAWWVLAAGVAAAAPSLTRDRGRLARYRGAAAGAASPVVGTAAGETPAVPGQGRGRRVPPQRPISRMSASQAVAGSTRGQSAS
jgi:sulfoxide reductase heme-binding subunit YedZ